MIADEAGILRWALVAGLLGGLGQSAEELRSRGVDLLRQNQPNDAIVTLEEALRLDPQSAATRFHLGRALLAVGLLDRAAEELQSALPGSIDPGAVRYQLGLVWLAADRLADAWSELGLALESRPELRPAELQLAEVCYRTGAVAEARRRLSILADETPRWPGPEVRAAELAMQAGEPAAAADWLARAVEITPDHPGLWQRRGDALAAAFDNAAAEAAYRRAAELAPEVIASHVALGYHLFNVQRFEAAEEILQHALQLAPGDPAVQLAYTETLLYLGRGVEALTVLEQAIATIGMASMTSERGVGSLRVRALELQAKILIKLGRLDEAERVARALVEVAPRNVQGHFDLGTVLRRRGDPDGVAHLRTFKQLSDGREHRELGDEYLRLAGDADAAEREYRAALEIDPLDVGARVGLARALLMSGDASGAADHLENARTQGADSVDWHRSWVLALHAAGRIDEARAAWEAARQHGLVLGPTVWAALRDAPGACPVEVAIGRQPQ